jgi:glutathione S-transferase
MLLYNSQVSGNCYKVRLLLAQLGVGYERREMDVVDRSDRQRVLGDLNPALRVPTLVLDDGRALAESGAILWCAFSDAPVPREMLEAKRRGGYAALEAMERHLSAQRFLVGDRYTIADIGLYAYTHVAGEGGFELTRFAAVRAWLGRVAAQPGHVPMSA